MTTEFTATTDVIHTELNKAMLGDGTVLGIRTVHARIRYTGSVWEFSSANSSAMGGVAIPVWSTDHLEVAFPVGLFTNPPVIFLTPTLDTALPGLKGYASTNVLALIYFRDAADAAVTTEATTMDINFMAMGA